MVIMSGLISTEIPGLRIAIPVSTDQDLQQSFAKLIKKCLLELHVNQHYYTECFSYAVKLAAVV